MSSKPMLYKIFAIMLVITVLSGCNLNSALSVPTAVPTAAAPTDTLAPTQDQDLLNTQAAETVAAFQTLNVPSETPVTPTLTETPVTPTSTDTTTPTVTVTATNTVTPVPPTATFAPWTKTPTVTPNGYSCAVVSTTPASTDTVKINTAFNFTWVIQNNGPAMWGMHNADLRFVNGSKMQTGADSYDLTKDVYMGDTYTATVAMKSPSSADTYTAVWTIVQDGVTACTLNLSVKVTN
jgi:hypothetical protein